MKKAVVLICTVISFTVQVIAQQYRVACIGFYNLENLFDTLDDPHTFDEEFTPAGARLWDSTKYHGKLRNLARVIAELGTDLSPDGPVILGVAEVENRRVLEDLVAQPAIAARNYRIVHFDSPDRRGIDVGLLYQPTYFRPLGARSIRLDLKNQQGDSVYTRDILYVTGLLDTDTLHILVNHWPSRRGGEKATRALRNAAAAECRAVKDSLIRLNPDAKVIVMGDLNDDPTSPSVAKVLLAKPKKSQLRQGDFYNPWYEPYKKGLGTLAYQDAWSLFDQIIITEALVSGRNGGYRFYQARVFNPGYLVQKTGQFKGYPYRTFDFDNYIEGYSDHFPVCIYLLKPVP
ncbi:MAG: endonuclease [Saprospiraceae bacterium]|nr:MAG: endonuclease [Saprospiraceae bacterium]